MAESASEAIIITVNIRRRIDKTWGVYVFGPLGISLVIIKQHVYVCLYFSQCQRLCLYSWNLKVRDTIVNTTYACKWS